MDAYRAAAGQRAANDSRAYGSMSRLIADYGRSSKFQNLKPSSQRMYRIILDMLDSRHGHRIVREMQHRDALRIVETVAEESGPALANTCIGVLGVLLKYAVKTGIAKFNVAAGIERYKGGTHRAWTEAELKQYEDYWPLGTRQRLAFDLLLYLGQRVSDAARIERSDKAIQITQQKTGAVLDLPIHDRLLLSMNAHKSSGKTIFGAMKDGRQLDGPALSMAVQRARTKAGLPIECRPHGLRKTLLTLIADAGGRTKELQSVGGHKTLKEIERYTQAADQRKLSRKAMKRVKRRV